jgi:hypothetical protein
VAVRWHIKRRLVSTHHRFASSINDQNHNAGITAATVASSQPSAISCDINAKSRARLRNPTAQGAAPSLRALQREMATWRMTSAPNNGKDQMRSERIPPRILHAHSSRRNSSPVFGPLFGAVPHVLCRIPPAAGRHQHTHPDESLSGSFLVSARYSVLTFEQSMSRATGQRCPSFFNHAF